MLKRKKTMSRTRKYRTEVHEHAHYLAFEVHLELVTLQSKKYNKRFFSCSALVHENIFSRKMRCPQETP